jgi:sugar/nucleoside kinase (ribokinase family)
MPEVVSIGDVQLKISLDLEGVLGKSAGVGFAVGGSAAEFALQMARMGLKTLLVGQIAQDTIGRIIRSRLEGVENLEVHLLEEEDEEGKPRRWQGTGWEVTLLPDERASSGRLPLEIELERLTPDLFEGARLVHISGSPRTRREKTGEWMWRMMKDTEDVQALIKGAKELGALTSLDLGKILCFDAMVGVRNLNWLEGIDMLLVRSCCLLPESEEELRKLIPLVVLKTFEGLKCYAEGECVEHQEVSNIHAFYAALLAARLKGKSLREAVEEASTFIT